MIQQQMTPARRWRDLRLLPNTVLSVCLHFGGRTEIVNETVNETVCCSGRWRRMSRAGVGDLSGDVRNGDGEQRLLSEQVMGHGVCSPLEVTAGGQLPLALFFVSHNQSPADY